MAKNKKMVELEKQIKMSNLKTILHMRDEGWCSGCNENVYCCIMNGKCKGQEELENVKQKNI